MAGAVVRRLGNERRRSLRSLGLRVIAIFVDMGKGVADRLRPAGGDLAEIRIALLDPTLLADLELVLAVDQEVDRHADREVGTECRIKRDQDELRRNAHAHVGLGDAVENRLAVFVLPDLEISGVLGRLDEVALLVDLEEARRLAGDLAAQDEGRAEESRVLVDHFLLFRLTSRTVSPANRAAWNMVLAVASECSSGPRLTFSFRSVTTDCVKARFPADIKTRTRSPTRSQTCIFEKVETLSKPAFVRVSDAKMIPRSSRKPTQ